jgi:hypothetical protein
MAVARQAGEGRAIRVLVAVPVVCLAALIAAYLAILKGQGDPPTADVLTVPFVAGYLALMAGLLLVSLLNARWIVALRPALRAGPSAGLLLFGVLALFSIGLPIVVLAGFATAATVLTLVAKPSAAAIGMAVLAGVVSVALAVGGFEFAWHYLVCPPTGQSGGTTAGFFDSISYECNDGTLTVHR